MTADRTPGHGGNAGLCGDCEHRHTANGCDGPPSPSDLWAGVSPSACDCDAETPRAIPTRESLLADLKAKSAAQRKVRWDRALKGGGR